MSATAKVQSAKMAAVLQAAINTELTVSQHYWSRAVYWRSRQMKRLAEMYSKEADEERGHAQTAADRLTFLGTDPAMSPESESPGGGTLREQFEEDLAGEVAVANTYGPWIEQALDAGDYTTFKLLSAILEQTEEHVDFLQAELDKASAMGEENWVQSWS